MMSAFNGKLPVNNGNWLGDMGRYRNEIGVNRFDVGARADRSASTRSLFDCESGTSENWSLSFSQNSVGFYGAGTNRYRNIQLKKNWTRARHSFKRVSIGVSGSSGICFVMGNLSRSALFSGFNANA